MQLLKLRLHNFRQHERTELDLGPGLLAVVGPNGSGKSTLLEAIAWALYGTAAARGTRDTIKRRGAPPRSRVEVELEFALGAHHYRLSRTLTNAELAQDSEVIANSTGAVTDRVISILGMTRDEFFNTYFTGQKELAVMASMTPSERGKFLSRVLGYEKLREAQDSLRSSRSAKRAELAGLEQGLADPDELAGAMAEATAALERALRERENSGSAIAEARVAMELLEPTWRAAVERRTAWQGLDGERRVAEGRVITARTVFEALDKELAASLDAESLREPLATRLVELPSLLSERDRLDQAAALVTARSKAVARLEAVAARVGELESEVATLSNEADVADSTQRRSVVLAAREAAEARLADRRTRWKQDEQEAKTKLEALREDYRELRHQHDAIEKAGPDGTCPFCTRPLGKDFPKTLELLSEKANEVLASGNYFHQRVDQLRAVPEDLKELEVARKSADMELRAATEQLATAEGQLGRRARLVAELSEFSRERDSLQLHLQGPASDYDAARHSAVRAQLAELEPLTREHDRLAGLAARAEKLVQEAAGAERSATEAEQGLAELNRRIEALNWDVVAFTELETRMQAGRELVQQAEVREAKAIAELEGAIGVRETAVARQKDRADKARAARELMADVERLSELDRAFGELRIELNLQLRPDLAERSSDFLQELTDGRYSDLELSEEYIATVVEDGEAKPVISGGEEDLVNLSLRLAISQMIADRAGQPLSLLILDEVFGSLDEERRHSVVRLLRAVADRFPQVILITHVEGLRDAFDRVVRMEYTVQSGVTTVREDQPELVDAAR